MLDVGCAGIPGRSSRAWLGRKDCSMGGGGPRREEVEQKKTRDHHYKPQLFPLDQDSTENTCDAIIKRESIIHLTGTNGSKTPFRYKTMF